MTHVVVAADASYLEYVHCVIGQVAEHASTCDGVILVVPPGLQSVQVAAVQRTGADRGISVDVVELADIDDLVPTGAIRGHDHVTAFTFSKLVLPTALPSLDQILYLDIDVLVRDSLDVLLDWDLTHPIGAVNELGDGAAHLFGSTRASYFNAGVLRMSLEGLRKMDLLGTAREILRDNPRLPFHDQDVLNLIFRDSHDVLPLAFNMFEPIASAGLPAWKVLTDPAIVHFIGPDKPWLDGYSSSLTREWRAAQARALSLAPDAARAYVQPPPAGVREGLRQWSRGLVRRSGGQA